MATFRGQHSYLICEEGKAHEGKLFAPSASDT